ncbi:MAG: DUF2662 domain-containing protein, partial [Actinomycetales bacterium]
MAGVLQRFEQRLEGAVTGAFARAFRSAVQPVEIAAALQREIDNSAHVLSRERMLVPNDFTVELSTSDHERLAPFGTTLSDELATLVKEHVKEQRYTLAGPLTITFVEAPELGTGRFRVRSKASAVVRPVEGQRMTDLIILYADEILIFVSACFFISHLIYLMFLMLSLGAMRKSTTMRVFRKTPLHLDWTPRSTILVPAYNEEKCILDSVESLLGINHTRFQVFVINDGSKDKT